MASYLDKLTDDNFVYILEYITNCIENKIEIIDEKLRKLNVKINPLIITNYEYCKRKFICIDYDNVSYCLNNYLFNTLGTYHNIIFIYIYQNENLLFISKELKNPTYLDILIEANKAVVITDDYDNRYLDDLREVVNKNLIRYENIKFKKDVKYYEFVLSC
tara:strand:+ start:3225 stop:3707 length:483 start_codon:yes stop_codon:yes gene_type:complete